MNPIAPGTLVAIAVFVALSSRTSDLPAASRTKDEGGLYIGAGLGLFTLQAAHREDGRIVIGKPGSNDLAFKSFAGWRFGKLIAVELALINFGGPHATVDGVEFKSEVNGAAPYLVGILPLGPAELFAKAGYLYYDLKFETAGMTSSAIGSEHFLYAAGAGLTVWKQLQVRVEYEWIDVSVLRADADALWLSCAWRF